MDEQYYRQSANQIIDNMQQQSRNIKRVTRQLDDLGRQKLSGVSRKQIRQGPRGGLYYLNSAGNKVYLTPGQCQRCKKGNLPNSTGCPPGKAPTCQATRKQLKKALRLSARQLKKKRKDC